MCGIAGRLEFDPACSVDPALIRRMCAAIEHRGPDDEGVWTQGPIGLGHRRLSILDLSSAGHQPMPNVTGTLWITFNGEIYNFLDLRADLERAGVVFRSRTDTEVILHLYEREGVECLKRLRGMFAFAIWDTRAKALFMARDRIGVKPLCYHTDERGITFASEIKAVLQDPGVSHEPDPVAIHHYLTYQSVPAPLCAFRGIQKLPPGHYLLCRGGRTEVKRYWRLSYEPKRSAATRREQRDLEAELLRRFEESVRLRLISDVPLGAFLSGGVDSSAVVAMMSRCATGPVRTFSIGFDDASYDELGYARLVAERLGTRHTELTVRPDALEVLPKLTWHYDEPYADASAIPTYYVSKMAREHVTVVLNGDAGDENFAGYDRHVANQYAHQLRAFAPIVGSRAFRGIVDAMPAGIMSSSKRFRLHRFLAQLHRTPQARNAAWMSQFDPEAKQQLYTQAFRHQVGPAEAEELLFEKYRETDARDFIDQTLYADVNTYLPNTLLVKVDIASMANSLEARSPFLDHTFMEFAARLPVDQKIRGGRTKIILRRALRGVIPDAILDRPKMGFSVPIDHWLRNELKDMSHDLLLSQRSLSRGYFRSAFVERMLTEHADGRRKWHTQIWNLMMLESWLREFVDQPAGVALARH